MKITKRKIFIGLFILFLIFLFFILNFKAPVEKNKNIFPTPTVFKDQTEPKGPPIPGNSQKYKKSVEQIQKSELESLKTEKLLGGVLEKIPYFGQDFSFIFDYETGQFVLTIDKNNIEAGNINFDNFLKKNNINSRSLIRNLKVEYK